MAEELDIDLRRKQVRKWGRVRFGISEYGDPDIIIPTDPKALFVPETHLPVPFPTGVFDMGLVTTDGLSMARGINANSVPALQTLVPVRHDLEGIEDTFSVAFMESNAWTDALYNLVPPSQWPASKDGAYSSDGVLPTDLPDLVFWMVGQDFKGINARFRYKVWRSCRITSMEDRTMNRTDPETYGFTFGVMEDDETGSTHIEANDGPGYPTHLNVAAPVGP